MGQKTHPIGFRLGIIKDWNSKWFATKEYVDWLEEDVKIRRLVHGEVGNAGIAECRIQREPHNLQFVEHVTRALLATDDVEAAKRAFRYARQWENAVRLLRLQIPQGGTREVIMQTRIDQGLGKSLVYQSRALGNMGQLEEAVEAAHQLSPEVAVPMHYGSGVAGAPLDGKLFCGLVKPPVQAVLLPNEGKQGPATGPLG